MGTTGRFGGSVGLTSRGGHTWYDTDYSELYIGLAVVLGFFILLVIFLIILFTIIYIRRKYCLKTGGQRRQQNLVIAAEEEPKRTSIAKMEHN